MLQVRHPESTFLLKVVLEESEIQPAATLTARIKSGFLDQHFPSILSPLSSTGSYQRIFKGYARNEKSARDDMIDYESGGVDARSNLVSANVWRMSATYSRPGTKTPFNPCLTALTMSEGKERQFQVKGGETSPFKPSKTSKEKPHGPSASHWGLQHLNWLHIHYALGCSWEEFFSVEAKLPQSGKIPH